MRRSIPLALLALAACTPVQWARQDTTPEQFNLDHTYCRREAWVEAQWRSMLFMNRSFGATTFVDPHGRTVLVPFSPLGSPFSDAYFDEARLTAFCMRAKGYELVPVKPES